MILREELSQNCKTERWNKFSEDPGLLIVKLWTLVCIQVGWECEWEMYVNQPHFATSRQKLIKYICSIYI